MLRENDNQDQDNLIEDLEQEHGGKIRFKTFAFFLGKDSDVILNKAGLLYVIEDRLYFEDFPKTGGLARFFTKMAKYEKFKFSIPLDRIVSMKTVSYRNANRCISGRISAAEVPEVSTLAKIFSKNAWQLDFDDGDAYFFDILDYKAFYSFCKENGYF